MFSKLSQHKPGYVLISVTVFILTITSLVTAIILFQNKNIKLFDNHDELRDVREQVLALQLKTFNELQNSIFEYSHLNSQVPAEYFIEGENGYEHFISIVPSDGCLNLTALIYRDLNGNYRGLKIEQERFQWVLQNALINPEIVNLFIDYQDSDGKRFDNPSEQELPFPNRPFMHISEVLSIANLSRLETESFLKFFCVNQIDRQFNVKAMPLQLLSSLFPFIDPSSFSDYLNNNPYQNINTIADWEQYVTRFLKRSLTPDEKKFFKVLSVENKTIEMLVRSSKKEFNWLTKFKFEMPNQNEVMTVYQLGPLLENE